jgi:hypothetical protein
MTLRAEVRARDVAVHAEPHLAVVGSPPTPSRWNSS